MVVDRAAPHRAADMVVDRVVGGSCCSCYFRKAGKGKEEVNEIHSHILCL